MNWKKLREGRFLYKVSSIFIALLLFGVVAVPVGAASVSSGTTASISAILSSINSLLLSLNSGNLQLQSKVQTLNNIQSTLGQLQTILDTTPAESYPDLKHFLANLPKDPAGASQRFERALIGSKDLVYFSQRMIGDAIVEKDKSIYVFDAQTEKLKDTDVSFRPGLPERLPAVISQEQAEAAVDGQFKYSNLYYASPDSDVFIGNFDRSKPIWAVTSLNEKNEASLTIIDATTGKKVGRGIPPPSAAYSMNGPVVGCGDNGYSPWSENAAGWFSKMGYSVTTHSMPSKADEGAQIQDSNSSVFFELAHGDYMGWYSTCSELTTPYDIQGWLSYSPAKQFAFLGSCGGLCQTGSDTISDAFRKGSYSNSAVVGYCGMSDARCATCWAESLAWQDNFFNYLNQGYTVQAAFDKANTDFPNCGSNSCMRVDGDQYVTLTTQSQSANITSPTSASATVGQNFSYQITASNYPNRFSASSLPSGLSVNVSTGLISGVPQTAGVYTLTLAASSAVNTARSSLTLTVSSGLSQKPTITSSTSASATVGQNFSYQITASGNPTSFLASGLPSGLSVNASTGLISGTPQSSGNFSVTLGAVNAAGTGSASLGLTIGSEAASVPVITSPTSVSVTVGQNFSYQTTATGRPYFYNAIGLPSEFTFNSRTGLIYGTPSSEGTYMISLRASNEYGMGSATLTLTVSSGLSQKPTITSSTSASATVGQNFSYQITASGNPTSFLASGLPSGLSVNASTGLISGTPQYSGNYSITLGALNSAGTGSASLSLAVSSPSVQKPTITSSTSASATVGQNFSYQITASGNPTSFLASGLPSGLSVNASTGLISGTPQSSGNFSVTLGAVNAAGTGSASLGLSVGSPSTSAGIYFISPSSGQTLSGSVSVTVDAKGFIPDPNMGVRMVIDNMYSYYLSPTSNSLYSVMISSTRLTDGAHTLNITAQDLNGKTYSAALPVSVSNGYVQGSRTIRLTNNLSAGYGYHDPEVYALQQYLYDKGYLPIAPTGIYGEMTSAAVEKMQKDHGLDPTGTVGPKTRALINADSI